MKKNGIFTKIKHLKEFPRQTIRKATYFVLRPHIFLKNRINIIGLKNKPDTSLAPNIRSDLKLDLVVPTVDKDFEVALIMIDSAIEQLKHPIGKVYVISPDSSLIANACKERGFVFVNENEVLPITKKDVVYKPFTNDRSSWLFQQFLKWGASDIVESDHFLVSDSDTVYIRPRVFEHSGNYIIPCSDEIPHIPYYEMCYKLFGDNIKPYYNFTSHHAVYNKKILRELKDVIEKRTNAPWYEGIMKNISMSDGAGVSDYETYQQYIYKYHPQKVILEHWRNLSLSRKLIKDLPTLKEKYKKYYKVISFHSYSN